MDFGRSSYYVGRRRRKIALPVVMTVAVLGAGALFFVLLRPITDGTVTDAYDGRPLGNVLVTFGREQARTDKKGRFNLTPKREPETLSVVAPEGYSCAGLDLPGGANRNLMIVCRPTTLSGTIRRKGTDEALPGVVLAAVSLSGERSTEAISADDGSYALADVPEHARLVVEGPDIARKELPIGSTSIFDLDLRADIIGGIVRDRAGHPLPGVTVGVVGLSAVTDAAGAYVLQGVPDDAVIAAQAPGYRARRIEPVTDSRLDITLDLLVVRGIYANPDTISNDAKFNALLALVDRTEINAMVIDLKDEAGWLHYPSRNPTAQAIGAIHLDYDLGDRLAVLRQHNVYAIARIVCMLDPLLAAARPDLAVRNSKTGGIWKNTAGLAWANPMKPEVWQYDTDLALEAADLGFDEVQFDYVRFPSDGDMDALDFGIPDNSANRTAAIYDFLKLAHTALGERGVALGADIFGIALWDPRDNGIGQQLEKIAPVVDYLCPMIYPSHFAPGSFGYPLPNDHPYDVVRESLENGVSRLPNDKAKFRPWLQDFTYGPGIDYGPKEVRAQIQAAYDFGATSWMIWNAHSVFTERALER